MVNFSLDRADRLLLLSQAWKAPISAVLYFDNFLDPERDLKAVKKWCETIPSYRQYVDVHIVRAQNVCFSLQKKILAFPQIISSYFFHEFRQDIQ